MELLVINFIAGIAGASSLSLSNYAKAKKGKSKEPFNYKKFTKSAIVGGAIGAIGGTSFQLTPEMTAVVTAGVSEFVENIFKAIARFKK